MTKRKTPDRQPSTKRPNKGEKKRGTKTTHSKITQLNKPSSKVKQRKKRKPLPRCNECGRTKRWCTCSDKGGRPSKLEWATVQKLRDIFRVDGTVEEACAYAKISTSTYYDRYKKGKEFLDISGTSRSFVEEMDQAQVFPFITAKKTLLSAAQKGDTRAAIEFLKRRHPDYGDKTEQTITTNTIIHEDDLIDD